MSSGTASASLHPLITQTLVNTKRYYCPFLDRGYCRESSRCNFSHEIQSSTRIPTDYCHFYLANQCLYGQDCKFRHTEPPQSSISPLSNPTTANLTTISFSSIPIYEELIAGCSSNINNDTNTNNNFDKRFKSSTGGPVTGEEAFYALMSIASGDINNVDENSNNDEELHLVQNVDILEGEYSGHCSYPQGLVCDLCGRACLLPYDLQQQRQHREDCLKEHEREMELSFAVQRSKDKVCGICMDTVVEKKPITSSRFGILEKCNHIFCLDCIRKWRGTKQFETRTIRACPECRVSSDFVVPSKYWIEDQEDKEKLIRDYKAALRSKPCKYFDEGRGECPFAGSCFYKHAYPDGRIAKLENPKPRRRFHGGYSRAASSAVANYILWNILTSTDEDEWSNDDLEELYLDPHFGTTDDEDDDLDEGDDEDDDDEEDEEEEDANGDGEEEEDDEDEDYEDEDDDDDDNDEITHINIHL